MSLYYLKRFLMSLAAFAGLLGLLLYVFLHFVLHINEQKAAGLGAVAGGTTPVLLVVALVISVLVGLSVWISSKVVEKPQ